MKSFASIANNYTKQLTELIESGHSGYESALDQCYKKTIPLILSGGIDALEPADCLLGPDKVLYVLIRETIDDCPIRTLSDLERMYKVYFEEEIGLVELRVALRLLFSWKFIDRKPLAKPQKGFQYLLSSIMKPTVTMYKRLISK